MQEYARAISVSPCQIACVAGASLALAASIAPTDVLSLGVHQYSAPQDASETCEKLAAEV